jgi:signal transduction histidine kinase
MASVRRRIYHKQILLFVIAVLLPSAVLIGLTWRMVGQQEELREKRRADERQRLAREIGQRLLVRLEEIKLREVSAVAADPGALDKITYAGPEVVLIGLADEDELRLPWEMGRTDNGLTASGGEMSLTQEVREAEHGEFAAKEPVRADTLYRKCLEQTRPPAERAYLQLSRARVLAQAGDMNASTAEYRKLLSLGGEVTDEHGIPFCVYAAGRLLEMDGSPQETFPSLEKIAGTPRWLSPAACYAVRDLLNAAAHSVPDPHAQPEVIQQCRRAISQRLRWQEAALRVQRDFPTLRLMTRWNQREESPESVWVPYGEEPLLIGLAPAAPGRPQLTIVVEGGRLLDSIRTRMPDEALSRADVRFTTGAGPEGEPLGPSFPGLRIISSAGDLSPPNDLDSQRAFYVIALLLVLCATGFGAYSLWKDVGRELRTAELRSHFVASVSHELKTPLTAIRMSAETLRLGRCEDPRTRAEYLDAIVNESHRLTRLLNNVLDFSRIEKDKRAYHQEPADLATVAQTAVQAMQYPLTQQDFHLETSIEEDLPTVRLDRDAFEQALLNLLSNAMKYSGESKDIALRVYRRDDCAVIEVTDHGIGIPEKEQQHIFERFYRVPGRDNAGIPGAGLGLALVAHIVQAHNGRVAVQSAPGQGSTFSIYLPLENMP